MIVVVVVVVAVVVVDVVAEDVVAVDVVAGDTVVADNLADDVVAEIAADDVVDVEVDVVVAVLAVDVVVFAVEVTGASLRGLNFDGNLYFCWSIPREISVTPDKLQTWKAHHVAVYLLSFSGSSGKYRVPFTVLEIESKISD